LRANRPMIIMREIGLSFFSFNKLHYLESVISKYAELWNLSAVNGIDVIYVAFANC
jgi:hypothetical protein